MMIEALILLIFVVTLSFAVYRIAQFSTKETPFEEALAEQRQRKHLEISPPKEKSQKKQKDKAKKIKMKKEESHSSQSGGQKDKSAGTQQKNKTKDGKKNSPQRSAKEPVVITDSQFSQNSDVNLESLTLSLSLEPNFGQNDSQAMKKQKVLQKQDKKTIKKVDKERKEDNDKVKTNEVVEKHEVKVTTEKNQDNYSKKLNTKEEKNNDKKDKKQGKGDVKDNIVYKGQETNDIKGQDKKSEKSQEKQLTTDKTIKEMNGSEHKKLDKRTSKQDKNIENRQKRVDSNQEKTLDQVSVKSEKNKEIMSKKEIKGETISESIISQVGKTTESLKAKKNNKPQSQMDRISEERASKQSSNAGSPKMKSGTSSPKTNSKKGSAIMADNMEQEAFVKQEVKVLHEKKIMKASEEKVKIVEQTSDKKKKKEKEDRARLISLSDDALSRLLPLIQKMQLSGGEIQALIEALLNKQHQSGNREGEWVEKGRVDPVMQLKRQLEETDTRLKEQVEVHQGLSAKIYGLRTDLNNERVRSSTLKKQLENSALVMQQKLDATTVLHNDRLAEKLNELKITLNKEFQVKLVQEQQSIKLEQAINERHVKSHSEIEKEMHSLKKCQQESETQCLQIKNALAESQQQLQTDSKDREALINTCQQYQQNISGMNEQFAQQESDFNARLYEIQQKQNASELAHSQALVQLTQFAKEKDLLLQQQINNLDNDMELLSQNKIKLKKTIFEKTDLENRLLQVENDLSCHKEKVQNQTREIECLKEEKESLASQSVRPAAEGQENGDCHVEDKQSLTNHISAIHEEQINTLTKEISRLKEEYLYLRRKSEEEKESMEIASRDTREVLQRIFPTLNVTDSLGHKAFLEEVEVAAEKIKVQEPVIEVKTEIVEKIVEKIVQDPSQLKQLEAIKKENAELQKKLVQLKEDKLALENSLSSSAAKEEEERNSALEQLESENKGLAEKIANYQDILANTESLLKSLQKSVESEESTWHEKLSQKEEVIRELVADKQKLALQVRELESSLQVVKQAEEMESKLVIMKEKLCQEELSKKEIQEELTLANEQLKSASTAQVSSNGPTNGIENDDESHGDTASVSSEGHNTLSRAESSLKKDKKKKSFFSKLIRKSTNAEVSGSGGKEDLNCK